jgi:hypothetical protein
MPNEQKPITNAEIRGRQRLAALEVLAMTSLGLYLANAKNDPDGSRTQAFLDFLRVSIAGRAADLPPTGLREAQRYGDELLSLVQQNLPALVGQTSLVN